MNKKREPMWLVSHEDVANLDMPPSTHNAQAIFINFSTCSADVLSAAKSVNAYLDYRPQFKGFWLMVDGFDEDPRELDQIPEAARAISEFGAMIGWRGVKAFSPEGGAMICVCMGWGSRVGMSLYIHPPLADLEPGRPLLRTT